MLVRPLTRPLVRPLTRRVTQPGFGWSPLALFAASEQGAWYDPSDLSSMNTKHDGSGAVPAVGDPVGYIADKSGRGNHAKQTTDTARPTLQLAAGRYYLQFDGVDDFLVTNAIDFTGTDKMTVVAGVRKDGSAAQILLESAGGWTGNGKFILQIDNGQGRVLSGYGQSGGTVYTSISYAAPTTAVFTTLIDRAQIVAPDAVQFRRDGAPVSAVSSSGTPVAGSFANDGMCIGARAGPSQPFNGRIYSLLVRGALSTQAQIEVAERYANSKTGAF